MGFSECHTAVGYISYVDGLLSIEVNVKPPGVVDAVELPIGVM